MDERKQSSSWIKDERKRDWKQRYAKLYSRRGFDTPSNKDYNKISFMSVTCPTLLPLEQCDESSANLRNSRASLAESDVSIARLFRAPGSEDEYMRDYASTSSTMQSDAHDNDTLLLDMVRARHRSMAAEALETMLELPREESNGEDGGQSEEAVSYNHSIRATDRSVSRSRISRISTRRDYDIPSLLANTDNVTMMPPSKLPIPAFPQVSVQQEEQVPRWSIRRSLCPVCSQKWKDRSSIKIIKNSGLKRNSTVDLPTVIAPARLRTPVINAYNPRPAQIAVDQEEGAYGGLRSKSASWRLTRARRIRSPKPFKLPETSESLSPTKIMSPTPEIDLDQRVYRFLTDDTEEPK